MIHVYPIAEEHQHTLEGTECSCDPDISWLDDETGLPLENGPLVIHECFTQEAYDEIKRQLEELV